MSNNLSHVAVVTQTFDYSSQGEDQGEEVFFAPEAGNIEDVETPVDIFIKQSVNIPLVLEKLKFSKHENVPQSTKTPEEIQVHLCQTFVESNSNFLFKNREIVVAPSYVNGKTEYLTDEVVMKSIEHFTSLYHDLYWDQSKSHDILVSRCKLTGVLSAKLQEGIDEVFEYGFLDGKRSGSKAILEIMGETKNDRSLFKCTVAKQEVPVSVTDPFNHPVPIKLESIADRHFHVSILLSTNKDNWKDVERRVQSIVASKLRCILNENESFQTKFDDSDSRNYDLLKQSLRDAVLSVYETGKYQGYHIAQSKFKRKSGVKNDIWIYSIVKEGSSDMSIYIRTADLLNFEKSGREKEQDAFEYCFVPKRRKV